MKPYSYDLRIRIFNYSLSNSIQKTADIFGISPNTVFLLKKLLGLMRQISDKIPAY